MDSYKRLLIWLKLVNFVIRIEVEEFGRIAHPYSSALFRMTKLRPLYAQQQTLFHT